MKKLKYVLYSLLFAIIFISPLTLVGCGRYYKVTFTIEKGEGYFYKPSPETDKYASEEEIKKGETFEYVVSPAYGYYVEYVKVNGEDVYNVNKHLNTLRPDEKGAINPCIEDVKEDISIVASFAKQNFTVTFFFLNPDFDGVTDTQQWLTNVNYQVEAEYQQQIQLEGVNEFGFVYYDKGECKPFNSAGLDGKMVLNASWELYTSKAETELITFLTNNGIIE